ncbi:hypothetical protein [Kibdelosporangium philippinense]|uniref:hypothetical protein n=1 Tax=Kibdelosporangium philippinense TaxID=211113 RepID=UPI00361F5BDC
MRMGLQRGVLFTGGADEITDKRAALGEVNLPGVVYGCRAALKVMREGESGCLAFPCVSPALSARSVVWPVDWVLAIQRAICVRVMRPTAPSPMRKPCVTSVSSDVPPSAKADVGPARCMSTVSCIPWCVGTPRITRLPQ